MKEGFKETDARVLHLNELYIENYEDREYRLNARNSKRKRGGRKS